MDGVTPNEGAYIQQAAAQIARDMDLLHTPKRVEGGEIHSYTRPVGWPIEPKVVEYERKDGTMVVSLQNIPYAKIAELFSGLVSGYSPAFDSQSSATLKALRKLHPEIIVKP